MSGVRGLRAQPLARLFRPLLRTAPRQFRAAKEKPEAIRGQVGEFAQLCGRRSEPDAALPWPQPIAGRGFYDIGEQSTATIEVETRAPEVLPKAQIVKIDTEGSEVDILSRDHAGISFRDKSANDRLAAAGLRARRRAHPPPASWNAKIRAQAPYRGGRQVLALTWRIPTRTCLQDCPWPLARPARGV